MKLYNMFFKNVDKEISSDKRYVKKYNKVGNDFKIYLNSDGCALVMESDIKKYWDYGGGVDKLIYAGEIDDDLVSPTLAEPDFVDEQIKSKKNGEIIGYQG